MAVAPPFPACAPCLYMLWRNYITITGDPHESTWAKLFEALSTPDSYLGDEKHPGWSPVVCSSPMRKDGNVTHLSALVLDVDGDMMLEEARELFGAYYGLIHTTRKHAPDHHRIRIVLTLSRLVTPEEHLTLWVWAQDLTGRRLDAKTRNVSRFWFLPGVLEGGAFEAYVLPGSPIDVDAVLALPRNTETSSAAPSSGSTHTLASRIKRASAYLRSVPPAIAGQNGHGQTWNAALTVVRGFDLPDSVALDLLASEYNPRCQPPWSERELRHKVQSASKDARVPIGYKLNDPVRDAAYEARRGGQDASGEDVEREAIKDEGSRREPGLELITDIFRPIERRNYLIPGLNIGPGAPNGFFAFSWGGKSIIVQDLVLSIATGELVFGQFTCRRGIVVHADYEQGVTETLDRYQRLARARGIGPGDVGDRVRVAPLPRIFLNTLGAEEAYKRACDGAALLYVDSLGAAQPGMVENEASFREGMDMLGRVSEATGVTVLLVGHTGKADLSTDKNPDGRLAPRGTSAIVAACGTAFAMSGAKGEPKLVTMIKGRSLGGIQTEDFYLKLEPVHIDDFRNPENPIDPGGFRIVYQTVQQVKPPSSPEDALAADVDRVVAAVRKEGSGGVGGADAVAALAGMKAARGRAAVRIAVTRGLLVNVAKKKNGERDEVRPRYSAHLVPLPRPSLKAGDEDEV